MTAGLLIPSILLAYGPAVVLFAGIVAPYPYMIASFFVACFAQAVSFILGGLVWVVVSTFGAQSTFILSWLGYVIIAESIRGWVYTLYIRIKRNFMVFGANAAVYPVDDIHFAMVSGLGWGAAESLLLFGNVILSSAEQGALFSQPPCHETGIPTVIGSSVQSTCLVVCNIALSVMGLCTYKYCLTGKGMVFTSSIRFITHFIILVFPIIGVYSESCYSPLFIPPIMLAFTIGVTFLIYVKTALQKRRRYIPLEHHHIDRINHLHHHHHQHNHRHRHHEQDFDDDDDITDDDLTDDDITTDYDDDEDDELD